MVGLLGAVFVGAMGVLFGWPWVRSFGARDSKACFGIAGLVGLGFFGLTIFILGLLRTTGNEALMLFPLVAGVITFFTWPRPRRPLMRLPQGPEWLAVLAVAFACLVGLVNVLAPSVMSDWDTIAYHLAVPKIWLADGQIHPISYIHHSNFPGTVDMLFLWGLQWGGQAGAKAFTLVYFLFGAMAIFGLARERYGRTAACWAVAAFSTIPVAVWETGTGYIDVAHGLYAGLGAWVLFLGLESERRGEMVVGGLLLGFAAGSKYTGLQALIGVGVVALVVLLLRRSPQGHIASPAPPNSPTSGQDVEPGMYRAPASSWKRIALAALMAIAVCAPWYVRNVAWTGNPVYPFFFERFGGKHWTQRQADVYRNEQSTFGVPREGPLSIPHAILGLAYQPGRYINPGQKLEVVNGQPQGATGNPLGAIGAPVMVALVLALVYWRKLAGTTRSDRFDPPQGQDASPAPPMVSKSSTLTEPATLAWILIGLLMWAMLSQQSRYMLSFAPPLCIMLGALIVRVQAGKVLAGLVVAQGLWTAYLCKEMLLIPERVQVAFGAIDPKAYLSNNLAFYDAAQYLNEQKAKRVALFDEVFGFYLDVPYFWAGYGHTDEMGYESMKTPEDFLNALKKLGIDRIYVNTGRAFVDPEFLERWAKAMGINGPAEPLSAEERASLMANVESRWRPLMAEAVAAGKILPEKPFRGGVVFKLAQ